jgi:hypothetical protein
VVVAQLLEIQRKLFCRHLRPNITEPKTAAINTFHVGSFCPIQPSFLPQRPDPVLDPPVPQLCLREVSPYFYLSKVALGQTVFNSFFFLRKDVSM